MRSCIIVTRGVSNNYRYRVNLVCDDIQVLAITAIFKMNRTLMITCKYSSASLRILSSLTYSCTGATEVMQYERC